MNYPKISIVTPSFNQAKYIEETIRSVVKQNYPNLEYIIIDGGSTDGTVEIIKKYESEISYWVSEKDSGQTEAINKGFKKATGDLVAWMNSDDIYVEGIFQRVAELYNKNLSTDVFYADKMHIDSEGNRKFDQRYLPYRLSTFANDKMVLCNQAAFWKRKVFEKIGYLDEDIQFAMDYEFFIRMGIKNLNFLHVPEIWGKQRYYEGTKTSDEKWRKVLAEDRNRINQKYGLKRNVVLKYASLLYRAWYYIRCGNFKYLIPTREDGV